MKAMAFLAGLGVGSMDEKQRLKREAKDDAREARRNAREDTADARATEVYNAGKTERERVLADDAFVRRESTPIDVVPVATMPETMDARDIGQPGEAPVPVTGYRAGARQFATQGVAQTSADDQLRERRTRALNSVDPRGAQLRETQGLQGRAAALQLSEAQQAADAKEWTRKANAAIVQSGSWEAAAQFMTQSRADGLDGSSQWRHTVAPDGQSVSVFPISPDGKPMGKAFTLPNTAKGRLQLLMTLDKSTPVALKLADMRAEENAVAGRDDKVKDNKRADDAEARRGVHENRMYTLAKNAAARAGGSGGPVQVTLKDQRDFESDFRSGIKDAFPIADGTDDASRNVTLRKRSEVEAAGNAMFRFNAMHGNPLTSGTVLHATALAQDEKVPRVPISAPDGKVYEGIVVNGQAVITGGEMRPKAAVAGPTGAIQSAAAQASRGVQAPKQNDRPVAGVGIDERVRQAAIPVIDRATREQAMSARRSAEGDQELIALDLARSQLLRAGKAAQANAAMEKFKQLRQDRYGF